MVGQDMPSKKPKKTTLFSDNEIKAIADFIEKCSHWKMTLFYPTTQPIGPIAWEPSVIKVQFKGYERSYARIMQAEDLTTPEMEYLSYTLITSEVVALKQEKSETRLNTILNRLGNELNKYQPGITDECDFANIHHRV